MAETAFSSAHCWKWWLGLAAAIALLDQTVKYVVIELLPYGSSYLVTSFFSLVHLRNTGAAFSLLADAGGWQRYAFVVLGIGVSVFLVYMLKRGVENRYEALAYSLILGGALGNTVDRVVLGYVTDYLDFHWRGWHWPAFNVADIGITLGACALLIAPLLPRRSTVSNGVASAECARPSPEHK